jgi:DNA repair protein SbcD/Mre11
LITAIVTSDNHLGAYYARLRPDRLEQRRRRLQEAFERIVDAAIEHRANLFLHAGDLFDRPDPRNAERCFVARQVRRLLDVGMSVVAIAGNHDSPRSLGYDGGVLPHEEIEALGAIRLFRNTNELLAAPVSVNGHRICVWGMSTDFNRSREVCPLEESAFRHERGGDLDLVLLHYGVEQWTPPFVEEPLLSLASLERLRTDAICVGHLHTRAEMRLPGGALVVNPGATEHIHFGEERLECGFWVLRWEPGCLQSEYIPLSTQPMLTLELPLPDEAPGETEADAPAHDHVSPLMRHLMAQMEQASHPDQLLRVRVTGRLPRTRLVALDLAALQARGNEVNFHCQLDTETLTIYDEFAELPLGYGVSFDVAEELQNTTRKLLAGSGGDPRQQETCRLAGEAIVAAYERLTRGRR